MVDSCLKASIYVLFIEKDANWNEILLDRAQSSGYTDFSMAENIIPRCSVRLKLDPVEDLWVNGTFHNACGPVTICLFKREHGENAKMEGGMTFCNMVIEADGKNGIVPAYEFTFIYVEDKTSVECEPVYSDKDDRFFQDYRFDISKLDPSAAKGKKVEVSTYLIQATHKAWMYIDITSKAQNLVELVSRSLEKLAVVLLPVLATLFAWAVLETLGFTIVNLRYVPLSQTGIFLPGWATKKRHSIHLT